VGSRRGQILSPEAIARKNAFMREYSRRPEVRERVNAVHRERWVAGRARRVHREYVARNRERIAARQTAWYQANRERIADAARQRYLADPERKNAKVREWVLAHPTRSAANHAAKSANRRAEMYNADGRLSGADVIELWRREPVCVDCGDGRGLDHVQPLARGGSNTSGNLANRCRSCNSRKGARERRPVAT
jgi:5-methylcytosine-specific restriction endonuclease McrA